MGKIEENLLTLAPVLNANSFEIPFKGVHWHELIIYPNNPQTNTKNYKFTLFDDGKSRLKINRISELSIEKEYITFEDDALFDLIIIEGKNGGGYPYPQLTQLLPIINYCHEFSCKRREQNTELKANFIDEGIALLVDISPEEIRYMVYGINDSKFHSELRTAKNIQELYNIAYAMQYCGNLHKIDMVMLTTKSESCHFNLDKSIEFRLRNNKGIKIAYHELSKTWNITELEKIDNLWTHCKHYSVNKYIDLEKAIEAVLSK